MTVATSTDLQSEIYGITETFTAQGYNTMSDRICLSYDTSLDYTCLDSFNFLEATLVSRQVDGITGMLSVAYNSVNTN